ncbi:P22 coat protein-gene protein 5 [Chlamydia trachomatis]|nr:P22 coat protein-gene protein 5 [Chlamydia trachomatis]CRH89775.1 P22 coat protein-gene protein 5 [Chlamydia trachomatis]
MSIKNFIPEIWSASILENFHNQAVLTDLTNRDYEGEVKSGSKIHIPGIVDVEVKDYKTGVVENPKGGGKLPRTTAPDELSDTGIDLVIDQEKSFDFLVDDIDRVQSDQSFDAYTDSASRGLVEDAEEFLTAMLSTGGTKVSGATAPTDWASAYGVVLKVRGELTKAKVPQANRVLLINASFEQYLLSDGSKLTTFDKSNSSDGLREATIGRLLGFDVVTSPWMDDSKPTAIGLHTRSVAFVSQVEKIESLRAEHKFADRIRGLHVYGGKILRPTAVQVYTGV